MVGQKYLISGAVSMGSMGSAEPIDFSRGVLEPIKFLEWKVRKLVYFGVHEGLLKQIFKADSNFMASLLMKYFLCIL